MLWVESLLCSFVHFLVLIKVEAKTVKDNDDVLAETEVINHMNKAFVTLVIFLVRLHQLLKKPDFHIRVVHIEFFVFAYLCCDYALGRIFVIDTLDNLSKSALVYGSNDFVSIANLFALFYQVLTLLICNRILVLPAHLANSVYALKHAHLDLLELRQLILKQVQCVLRAVAHLLTLLPKELRIERRHACHGTVRGGSVRKVARGGAGVRVPGGWRLTLAPGQLVSGVQLVRSELVAKLTVGLGHKGAEVHGLLV